MAAAEQQVHQRLMIQNHLQAAVQRFRRVTLLQRESFKDFLEDLKLVNLSRNVTTLVPAEYQLLSENLHLVLILTLTLVLRNMLALTELSLQSQSHRREWQLL